jgi:hypothetical protein
VRNVEGGVRREERRQGLPGTPARADLGDLLPRLRGDQQDGRLRASHNRRRRRRESRGTGQTSSIPARTSREWSFPTPSKTLSSTPAGRAQREGSSFVVIGVSPGGCAAIARHMVDYLSLKGVYGVFASSASMPVTLASSVAMASSRSWIICRT